MEGTLGSVEDEDSGAEGKCQGETGPLFSCWFIHFLFFLFFSHLLKIELQLIFQVYSKVIQLHIYITSIFFRFFFPYINRLLGFPGDTNGKEPACQCRRHKMSSFNSWVGKIPWRREPLQRQPTPVFLPGQSQGQRHLTGYSPQCHKESDMTEATQQACTQQVIIIHDTEQSFLCNTVGNFCSSVL